MIPASSNSASLPRRDFFISLPSADRWRLGTLFFFLTAIKRMHFMRIKADFI